MVSLISVPQLTRAGCTLIFYHNAYQIFRYSVSVANSSFHEKAYYLDLPFPVSLPIYALVAIDALINPVDIHLLSYYAWILLIKFQSAIVHRLSNTQTLDVWHKQLDHLSQDLIPKLATMSTGIIISNPKQQSVNQRYIACLCGFQHHHVSHVPHLPIFQLLEIVHIDIKALCDLDVRSF